MKSIVLLIPLLTLFKEIFSQNVQIPITQNGANGIFVSTIGLGTPAQQVTVLFDSGSFWLQVQSSQCTTCSQIAYTSSKSNSNACTSNSATLSYGSGQSLTGPVCSDSVTLNGGVTTGFPFIQVSSSTGTPQSLAGIMGIGYNYSLYSSQKKSNPSSIVQFLKNSGKTSKLLVSLCYDNVNQMKGSLTFGAYDPTLSNSISWFPVFDFTNVGWSVGISQVNGWSSSSSPILHIIDTGTNSIEFPLAFNTSTFISTFSSKGTCTLGSTFITCTCSAVTDLNNLVVTVSPNVNYTLSPAQFASYKSGTCTTTVKFSSSPKLGSPWIQWFYTIFDTDGSRLGMGAYQTPNAIVCGTASPTSVSKNLLKRGNK
jgi:hypothetical protein